MINARANAGRTYYATHNTRADLANGNRGFLNTWAVSRFDTRDSRDAFVAEHDNQLARAVTRKEAEQIWRDGFLCVGSTPPPGGLFGPDAAGISPSNFWNEYA